MIMQEGADGECDCRSTAQDRPKGVRPGPLPLLGAVMSGSGVDLLVSAAGGCDADLAWLRLLDDQFQGRVSVVVGQ
jgi:hypothetical protein